jgi:hypothetical protein
MNGWKRMQPEEQIPAQDIPSIARCFGIVVVLLVLAALEPFQVLEVVPTPGDCNRGGARS